MPVFSAQFILIFQPGFHLSPSGFFEPLTFILSSGAVRMTEVMLLALSLESWWWQWQLFLQAHRSLQVCYWYSCVSLISQVSSKKKEQLNQALCHPQNEKSAQQKPVGRADISAALQSFLFQMTWKHQLYTQSGTHRLKSNVTEHCPTCGVVRNFSCTLQNEKDLLGRIAPKSQGCFPASEVGFSDVGHIFQWALVALGTVWNIDVPCKWHCLCFTCTCCGARLESELQGGWIPACETNSSKQSNFVQRIYWSFSLRLVEAANSVHFQMDCAFVRICCIRREMNAWQCFVRT